MTNILTLTFILITHFALAIEAQELNTFLQKNCIDCHDEDISKGDVRFDKDISNDPILLEKAFLQIRGGDMPPPKKSKLSSGERAQLLKLLAAQHKENHHSSKRRLTKVEFINSLSDLLQIDIHPSHVASLPEDITKKEFNTIGNLGYSETHLQLYFDVVDQLVEVALRDKKPLEQKFTSTKFIYEPHPRRPKIKKSAPTTSLKGQTRTANGFAFPYFRDGFKCPEPGFYEITFTLASKNGATALIYAGDYYQDGALVNEEPRLLKALKVDKTKTVKVTSYLEKDDKLAFSTLPGEMLDVSNPVAIKGPLTPSWPPARLKELLPEIKVNITESTFKINSSNIQNDYKKCVQKFANKAFRQKVSEETLRPFLALGEAYLKEGNFLLAVKETFKALLSSPNFLYLNQNQNDQYALASRISYFLWRTTPDSAMLKAAYSNTENKELDRLLNSPKTKRFINDFTNQWLGLKSIHKVSPDYRLYPEYDGFFHDSLIKETTGFIKYLLNENKPLDSIIDSDFLYINNRLAKVYKVPNVKGPDFRIVKKPAGSPRGGILTQASVMVATADGASTTPVKRGVWLSEKVLGKTIPMPPKNIEGVEADLNGKKTIIEQLDAHRNNKACRSCHTRIDPYGVAFESFDPIGQHRNNYRVIPGNTKQIITFSPKGRFKQGPIVETAYTMANGQQYKNITDLKNILMADKEMVHRAFIQKLYMFALGRELSPHEILMSDAFSKKHAKTGFKTILSEMIRSNLFRGQQ